MGGSFAKGKEKAPPYLLADEDQAVTHLCLMLSDSGMESFKGSSTIALVKSTFFDVEKVSVSF